MKKGISFRYDLDPAINGPAGTWFIIAPIVIFKKNKIRKKIHIGGISFPYPNVIRMEMISIIRIEKSSGSHDADRGSICN
jgi:hypothetical protein